MSLKLISAPGVEPITLAEAKAHLRVEHDAEDSLIAMLIAAARQSAEQRLGRALIHQTWELILDAFPCAEIKLPKPPVASITSIVYLDANGDEQTLAGTAYTLDADLLPGWVLPAYGTEWPATLDSANALRVRFVAGYGADGSAVPAPIRQWMLITLGTFYANREAVVGGTLAELPTRFVDGLLDPYLIIEAV